MKLLLEYQQNPRFRTAYETLQQAEAAAREVYTSEKVSRAHRFSGVRTKRVRPKRSKLRRRLLSTGDLLAPLRVVYQLGGRFLYPDMRCPWLFFVPCCCPQSLVMNLSALRIRIVITYLHCPKHSQGLEPSMDDKALDKEQCQLYITNALKVR